MKGSTIDLESPTSHHWTQIHKLDDKAQDTFQDLFQDDLNTVKHVYKVNANMGRHPNPPTSLEQHERAHQYALRKELELRDKLHKYFDSEPYAELEKEYLALGAETPWKRWKIDLKGDKVLDMIATFEANMEKAMRGERI